MLFRSCCTWTGRWEELWHFADFDTEGCQSETHSFNMCFVSRSIRTFKKPRHSCALRVEFLCTSFHFQVVSPQQRDDNSEAATGFPFHHALGRHVGPGVFSAAFQNSLGYIFMTHPQFPNSRKAPRRKNCACRRLTPRRKNCCMCSSFNAVMLPLLCGTDELAAT